MSSITAFISLRTLHILLCVHSVYKYIYVFLFFSIYFITGILSEGAASYSQKP